MINETFNAETDTMSTLTAAIERSGFELAMRGTAARLSSFVTLVEEDGVFIFTMLPRSEFLISVDVNEVKSQARRAARTAGGLKVNINSVAGRPATSFEVRLSDPTHVWGSSK